MNGWKWMAMATMVAAVTTVMVPSSAEAFLRVGAEARWLPLADDTMKEGSQTWTPDRQVESSGVGIRALIGTRYFSVGPKLNLVRNSFDDSDLSYTQFDINAQIRSQMPLSNLALVAEGGPSMSLSIGEIGYNVGLAAEVEVLSFSMVDMNLGVGAQYASISSGTGSQTDRVNSGIRGLVTLGGDLALQ